nr:hypothetical protein [Tanacetum cinerariifolium]
MVGALFMVDGEGIGAVDCCRGAGGMAMTYGAGKVITCVAEGVSCTGVRTEGSKITDT